MASFIAVVVGFSLVFGVLMLAIAAEVYYKVWWKKKRPLTAREIDEVNTSYVQELLYVLSSGQQQQQQVSSLHSSQSQRSDRTLSDPEMGTSSRSLLLKSSTASASGFGGEESIESELMRLHNLAGPPRFLFTIKEETREDLDSDDRSRRGSRTRSLSDVIVTCETPFLSPIASPRIASSVLTDHPPLDFYNHLGFNPLYEATSFEEIECKLKRSPPPKFKFLRDAEEKLQRKLKEQMLTHQASIKNSNASSKVKEDQTGSLITLISGVKKDKADQEHHHHNSASSKVLPLASSPSRFKLEAS